MAQPSPRYHALDSMRATMMLLGIYLHVVVGYSGDGNWPYIDPHPTGALNWSLGLIHAFRMPAFFAMAGFFGALLWERRGPAAFASNRVKRILVPFAVFWSLLFPLMATAVVSLSMGAHRVVPVFTSGELLRRLHPMHLWFLEYLLLLYLVGAIAAVLSGRLASGFTRSAYAAYRWALQKPYAPVLFALFSWMPLAGMRGGLKDCDGFVPEGLILAAYLVPFSFGWLLFHSRDLLPRFEKHVWPYLALHIVGFFVYKSTPGSQPFLKAAANVLLCWFMIFASIGFFLRFCSRESPAWRYMSDSSYWLYIMHMPVVVGLQMAFLRVPLPAIAKIPVVLALSVAILVVSYDVLVRPTRIGVMLNGRRYPRGLPRVREEELVATA